MRGTFVAVGMLPTSPQSALNISEAVLMNGPGAASVRVEAAPGLLAEVAGRDHRLDARGHRAPIDRPIAADTSSPT